MKKYYIAYGSNLNVPQMSYRCMDARVIGTGELEGWQLLFKGSKTGAYLTIEPAEDGRVPIVVWEVSETDEEALDYYEGYPTFYYKTEMHVSVKGIKSGKIRERNAFVYIMREDAKAGIPSRLYVRTCMEGYQSFGFDPKILLDAIKKSEAAIK